MGNAAALDLLAGLVLPGAAMLDAPGFVAQMDPPTAPVSAAAATWTSWLNQNLLHPGTAPSTLPLDELVVAWLAAAFGFDGGHVVAGSSVATLTALWAARDVGGVREVVTSRAAHVSVRKAAEILGLAYREVDVDRHDRLVAAALGDVTGSAVVAAVGTVASGAIDPLPSIVERRPGWLHIDGAWGGPLQFSPAHRFRLAGIEAAQSIGFSAHKLLYQPKGCAFVLFADAAKAQAPMTYGGGYLRAPNIGVAGSRGASTLPLAALLLSWGADGLAAAVDRVVDQGQLLATALADSGRFEIRQTPETGICLFRPISRSPDNPPAAVRTRGVCVSHVVIDDEVWWRAVMVNPQADLELVVAVLVESLVESLVQSPIESPIESAGTDG